VEREIIRQLLEKFGPPQNAVIRVPVPFGPKKVKERRNFLSPVYKLIRYHRLTFTSIADDVLRWTYLPWIESITHVKAEDEEELELRLNSNYEKVWRMFEATPGRARRTSEKPILQSHLPMGEAVRGSRVQASKLSYLTENIGFGRH
jgi:hypothetical protein